jgi:hypothetical protein
MITRTRIRGLAIAVVALSASIVYADNGGNFAGGTDNSSPAANGFGNSPVKVQTPSPAATANPGNTAANVHNSYSVFPSTMADRLQGAGGNDTDTSRLSHPPRWTVSVEAIVLDRVDTAKQTLVERVPGTTPFYPGVAVTPGTPALNSTDLHQGFAPGFRLGITYHVDSNYGLESSFFHIRDWDSTRSIGPDNPRNWLVMRAPGGFFQTQDFAYQSMTWDYSTDLYSAEINAWKKFSDRITILAGFRWLRLHENLQGTTPPADIFVPTWKNTDSGDTLYDVANITTGKPAPGYPPFWNTSTTDNLYGLQIGADGKLFERGRFSIDGLIKLGGYWNHVTDSTGVSIAKVVYNASASTDHPAFVGEAGLQCKYQIASRIMLKIGYEVLWLAGVALAPGQIQETYTNPVYALGVNSNSHVLFHGGPAGLEFSF